MSKTETDIEELEWKVAKIAFRAWCMGLKHGVEDIGSDDSVDLDALMSHDILGEVFHEGDWENDIEDKFRELFVYE